jgi:hypothetical protein
MSRTEIVLPVEDSCGLLRDERIALQNVELGRPWRAVIYRDGGPGVALVLCGETEADVRALASRWPHRPGPNGPIDSMRWIRRGEATP